MEKKKNSKTIKYKIIQTSHKIIYRCNDDLSYNKWLPVLINKPKNFSDCFDDLEEVLNYIESENVYKLFQIIHSDNYLLFIYTYED